MEMNQRSFDTPFLIHVLHSNSCISTPAQETSGSVVQSNLGDLSDRYTSLSLGVPEARLPALTEQLGLHNKIIKSSASLWPELQIL